MFQRQRKSLSFSHLYIYGFASALLLIIFFVTPSSPPSCIRGVSKHTAAKQENFVLQWYQNIWNQQFNSHIYKLQQKHSIDSLKRWDFEKWPHPREKAKKHIKIMLIPLDNLPSWVVNKKSHLPRSHKLELKYMKPDIKLRWPQTHINKMFLNVSLPPNFG